MKLPAAITLLVLLAGTFSSCTKTVWVKAGGADADFARDNYQCLQEARYEKIKIGPFGGGKSVDINDDLYEACMAAKGYRKEKVPK